MERFMDITDALEMVLSLARDNIAPDELEFEELRAKQLLACDVVEDMIVNQFGED